VCYSRAMTQTRALTQCPGCRRWYGNLTFHAQTCLAAITVSQADAEIENPWLIRAAAHALPRPERAAQRFQDGVTDADVALVMYALESGAKPFRNRAGRWLAPADSAGVFSGLHRNLSTTVHEMVRTGLVRHVRVRQEPQDVLVPALVHLKDGEPGAWHSACLFTGEDLGPMRSRLVEDLALTDCLGCERVVALGHPRGL
jgi:hypothetical protein